MMPVITAVTESDSLAGSESPGHLVAALLNAFHATSGEAHFSKHLAILIAAPADSDNLFYE
jgi:hypothetical protein